MKLFKMTLEILLLLSALLFLILLIRGFYSIKSIPETEAWHDYKSFRETFNYSNYSSLEEYIDDEEKFITQIFNNQHRVPNAPPRFQMGSISNPQKPDNNLNRTSIYRPNKKPKGVAIVVHGLSDSPYHMLHIVNKLKDQGLYVINLRLPGHGTAPGALVGVKWREWFKAVDFAVEMGFKELKNTTDNKFIFVGFSTGGALLLRHMLLEVQSNGVRVPDRLFLYSPATKIDRTGILAGFHNILSWLPLFNNSKWMEINYENDPFKYRSFPKNAALQIYKLSKNNERLLKKISKDRELLKLIPPIITFQSPFDSTVIYDGIINIYQRIGNRSSKLVLFSENTVYNRLYKGGVNRVIDTREFTVKNNFISQLYILKNIERDSIISSLFKVDVDGENRVTNTILHEYSSVLWPKNVFAMTHISPIISPTDPYYGKNSILYFDKDNYLGEHGLLKPEHREKFIRLRYNPFISITDQFLIENIF